jgi:SEC-C motif
MDKKLHDDLIKETEKLRGIVAKYSTESIVGTCYVILHPQFSSKTDQDTPRLTSKVRQVFFLLGLMLTTEEPKEKNDFGKEIAEILESIFNKYFFMFLKHSKDTPNLTKEVFEQQGMVMQYFLNYFNTGLLASYEQVSDRITKYLTPFDKELKELLGLSASESLEIANFLFEFLQKQMDDTLNSYQEMNELWKEVIRKVEINNWDEEKLKKEMSKPKNFNLAKRAFDGPRNLCKIPYKEIEKQFGVEKSKAFWRNYVSKRGEFKNFQYVTERNLADEKTLFEVENGVAFCLAGNVLFWAILRVCEQVLLKNNKKSYLIKRGELFESQVEKIFSDYFPKTAIILSGVFETPELNNEHDLIIVWEKRLFIIEAKSTPPQEPFRDPERAFVRIRGDFKDKTGIQGAFNQAIRIQRKLRKGEKVELFGEKRNLLMTLLPNEIKNIYCICLTRDDFGPLATDLSLLLEKDSSEPFPWVIDIFSLETFFTAWKYFNWNPYKFCEYLNQRKNLHGKIVSGDELEVAGFFIKHGTLDYLVKMFKEGVNKIVLNHEYSDVFDEIYAINYGGSPVVITPKPPIITDSREILRKIANGEDLYESKPVKTKKVGRNEPCPCGSGLKYKKCHG